MNIIKNLYLSILVFLGYRSPDCKAPYEPCTYADGTPSWGKERCSKCKQEIRKDFYTA